MLPMRANTADAINACLLNSRVIMAYEPHAVHGWKCLL